MITFPLAMVLATWLTFTWHFLGVMVVLLCLFLIAIILIQDSKGAGLTSAFGAGPGGESLLGARMQKDVARWTAITAGIFSVIVLIMGLMGTYISRYQSAGEFGAKPPPAAESPAGGPGVPPGGPTPELPPPGGAAPGEPSKTSPAPAPGGATPGAPVPPAPGGSATPTAPPGAGSAVPTPPGAGSAAPPPPPAGTAPTPPAGEKK